ncbi:Uncharacterised protein [uncultured Ruminococcus sp.]|nr:Uncharacterised protein [uncultured Ruminococcus sp.]
MAFEPVQEEDDRRDRIDHADRAELMDRKDGGQDVVMEVIHDAVVGGQHACRSGKLQDIDEDSASADPVYGLLEMLGYKGAEHENEQVMEDDVVQPVYEGVVQERRVCRRRPDIAGIKIEDDVGRKQQRKRRERRLFHLPEQTAPKRHEKVKPQQDDEKVDMIHG